MNYYKITNKEEVHNGFQFHDGLNVDTVKWYPFGNCEAGGIFFARRDILGFLAYNDIVGYWIREVTIPPGIPMYRNPGSPEKWKAPQIILGKRRKITAAVIQELINAGADIHAQSDCPLLAASANNHLDVVKFLVAKGADVHARDDAALRWASEKGHLDVVKFLVAKGADVHAWDDYALRWASANNQLDVVKFLVAKGADVHARDDAALGWASANNHLEVVKFLRAAMKEGAEG